MIWEQYRIKDIALEVGSGTTPKSTVDAYYDGGTHEWVNTGDLNDDIVIESSTKVTDLAIEETSLRYFPKGTVIEAMYGATIGKVGLLSQPSTVNQACCAIVPNRKRINNRLLLYILRNYKSLLLRESFGGTQPNVNQHDVVVIPLTLPSLPDQNRIVAYLDEKTAAIDKQVSLLEQKKEKYALLKSSIIDKAVIEGIYREEKKQSNLDWLGLIPKSWKVRRIKDVAFMYSGLTGKAGDDFRCEDESLTKPFIPFTNILNNDVIRFDQFKSVVMCDNEEQNQVMENDLLFLMSSEDYESIGKASVIIGNPGDVYLNSFCRGLRFNNLKHIYPRFVCYQLGAKKFRDTLRFEARGFTRINLKLDRIVSLSIALPPLSEQKAIADYLDEKCAKIDAAVANIDQQIEKYKLLRRALINEVVTGQRAV